MPPRTSRGHDAADRRATAIAQAGLTGKAYADLRRKLREAFKRDEGRLTDLRRIFGAHGIKSQAARLRILYSLPRLECLRFYCRTLGLPEPPKWRGPCQAG